MPGAQVVVHVEPGAGDQVQIQLSANLGGALQPLSKVASGGELARAMLAVRLVLTAGPPVLVFDEVDAGIGGEAATAVGRALSEVADAHQVLVVTHLAQVAAAADAQVVVTKHQDRSGTASQAQRVDGEARLVELSRMLSGSPDSGAARHHAAELLASAARERRAGDEPGCRRGGTRVREVV